MSLTTDIVWVVIVMTLMFAAGWFSHMGYEEYSSHRLYDGLYLNDNMSQPQALAQADKFDGYGSWICVNVKAMTIQDVINTCEHEASHEIFAQHCTENPLQCLKDIGVKNGSS